MEYGGRWKPLHYTIRRTYAPVISHLLRMQPTDDTFQLWFVNDEKVDVTVSYVVEPVSWQGAQISEAQKVSNQSVRIPANSSFMATEVKISDLYGEVCDETTCFIKASGMAYKDDSRNVRANNLYNTYLFSSQMKDAQLAANPEISTSNFVQVNDKLVRFNINVSETSPFLFMELKDSETSEPFKVFGSNAGWFSDNNFLAEKGTTYTIDYESFSSPISVADFQSRLTSRVLQSIYSDADFAALV